jgi:hypothetical protein
VTSFSFVDRMHVSEETDACNFGVESHIFLFFKVTAGSSSEPLVLLYQTKRRHITEQRIDIPL